MLPELIEKASRIATQPYLIRILVDETTAGHSVFVASIHEMEGCMAQGETMEEALLNLRGAAIDYIASMLEDGLPVPPPSIPTTASSTSTSSAAFPTSALGVPLRRASAQSTPLYEFQFSIG
jgi:predicted RNase H-like HicB family nuclease